MVRHARRPLLTARCLLATPIRLEGGALDDADTSPTINRQSFPSGPSSGTLDDKLDAASGTCLQHIPRAHHTSNPEDDDGSGTGAAIWAVAMRPDGRGFCTCGADKFVKFWFHILFIL